MAPARGAAVVTTVVVLAGGALVAALPGSLPAVRLAGVGIVWWYWALAVPVVATCAALVVAACRRAGDSPGAVSGRDLTPWSSPALLVSLAALVFAGAPAAPLVAVAALAAPLAGRLLGDASPPTRAGRWALAAAAVLALCAELTVAGDVALAMGFGRQDGIVVAALLAAVTVAAPAAARLRESALALGVLGVALTLALVGVATALTPWAAWNRVASRPAIAFAETSASVTRGVTARVPATVRVGESQRVTALADGVFHVRERDGTRTLLREWRLTAGESLPLRAGDELSLSPGSSVRFEAGRRVPGAPASGVAWADPRGASPLAAVATFLGVAITLAGACAALPPRRARGGAGGGGGAAGGGGGLAATGGGGVGAGAVAVAAGVGLVIAATCWGVYGAMAGAELGIGNPPAGILVGAAAVLTPARAGLHLVLLAAGLAALLVAVTSALHSRAVVALAAREGDRISWRARLAGAGIVVLAASAAAFRPADGWRLLMLGAGLAAAAVLAPRLVRDGRARRAASIAGIAALAGLALAGPSFRHAAPVLADYPALAAVPIAWAVGWLLDRDEGRAVVQS
jgi:hypothetical protein